MTKSAVRIALLCLVPLLFVCMAAPDAMTRGQDNAVEKAITVQYLEIVTPDVDATCELLAKTHGVSFSDPVPEFGNSRTASLKSGGRIGVRGPMRETEDPVVRPYMLVEDIHAAVAVAEAAGAEIAMPPMELPGQGTFAIYLLGGIQHGLWQN